MDRSLFRILYAIEFLVALPAILLGWSQIGGQVHFDPIDWQWKLALSGGLALVVVRATAAAASRESAWNRGFVLWSLAAMLLMLGMGWMSYDQHLKEPPAGSEDEEDDARIEETRAVTRAAPPIRRVSGPAGGDAAQGRTRAGLPVPATRR